MFSAFSAIARTVWWLRCLLTEEGRREFLVYRENTSWARIMADVFVALWGLLILLLILAGACLAIGAPIYFLVTGRQIVI